MIELKKKEHQPVLSEQNTFKSIQQSVENPFDLLYIIAKLKIIAVITDPAWHNYLKQGIV